MRIGLIRSFYREYISASRLIVALLKFSTIGEAFTDSARFGVEAFRMPGMKALLSRANDHLFALNTGEPTG